MIKSPILNPRACKGWVSRTFDKGTSTYDLTNLYSPDTALDQSCVLDLASPKFEPNKTYIFDKSKFGNHGTITGATWERLPSGLWVNSFDGTDDVINCGATQVFNYNSVIIEVWLNSALLITNGGVIIIGTSTVFVGLEATSTSQLWLRQRDDLGFDTGALSGVVTGSNYYHIVGVVNGRSATGNRIYVNNVLKGTVDNTTCGTFTGASQIYIGYQARGTKYQSFKGSSFRLYTGASILPSVLNHYNQERHLFGV
jgi:hypothetical protein